MQLSLESKDITLKNVDKVYFTEKNYRKGDVIDYYVKVAPYLLPHLKDRPLSMIFFPEAKMEKSFYQKQKPSDMPDWISTARIPSKRRGHIDWVMVNDLATLVYLVNRSVLEMHTWFSRKDSLDKPDLAVIDLDPSGNSGIREAAEIACAFKEILSSLGLYALPKTSGSRGLHIFIPIEARYTFDEVQEFLQSMCRSVQKQFPTLCTTERLIKNRGDRIYLDAVQCGKGKTLAMPYSMRVKSGALVSTPLEWEEVNGRLNPADYDIVTIFDRLDKMGDLAKNLYSERQGLPKLH